MRNLISSYHAKIGRRGGLASTPAKRAAARRNALKRWGNESRPIMLPMSQLRDGSWYIGYGRNAVAGLWDGHARCFWTVALNDFANPESFPAKPKRQVRLKREDYFSAQSGTFKPIARLQG